MGRFDCKAQRRVTHAVDAQDSQCVESLRAIADDATDMVRRRQAICHSNAEYIDRRDTDYPRQCRRCYNLTLPPCVNKDDLRFSPI